MSSISAQLINLDEMNPFIRLERIETRKKLVNNCAAKTNLASGPGPRSRKTTQINKPLEESPQQGKDNPCKIIDPPRGRCIICQSHYCSKENVKLQNFFAPQLIKMMETLGKLVQLNDNNEDEQDYGSGWELGLTKSISENSLPFCTSCARTVHNLWSLDSQLDLIQQQISTIVHKIKAAVWLSTKLHKEKQVVKAKFLSAAFQVYPQSSTKPKIVPPVPRRTFNYVPNPAPKKSATASTTRSTALNSATINRGQTSLASSSSAQKNGDQSSNAKGKIQPPKITTAKQNTVSKKQGAKRPGPASKTANTKSAKQPCLDNVFKKAWVTSNAKSIPDINKDKPIDDVIDIKLELNDFEDDPLSCPADYDDDHGEFDDPADSPITVPTTQTIALTLPNFENDQEEDESLSTPQIILLTPTIANKKKNKNKRVRKDPLQTLIEESKDLIIDCQRPRRCAEAAKLSMALQKQSQEEGGDQADKDKDVQDPDVEHSMMVSDNSGSDEEFVESVKKSNPIKRKRIRTRNPDEPRKKPGRKRTRPIKVPKPKRSTLSKEILLAIEYEKALEIEHLGIKATKDESSGLWKCFGCQDYFPSQGRVRRHIVASHSKVEAKCNHCSMIFESKSDLTKHTSEAHTGERLYICDTCGKTYNNRGSLHWHTTWVHGRVTKRGPRVYHPCNICSKPFLNRGKLVNHMRTHTGERPFICEICSHATSTHEILRRHMQRFHDSSKPMQHPKLSISSPNKPTFPCTICERVFLAPYRLQQHLISHSSERQFKCDFCDHRLINKLSLNRHMSLKHPNLVKKQKGEVISELRKKELEFFEEVMEKKKKLWSTLPPRGRISAKELAIHKNRSGSQNLVTLPPTLVVHTDDNATAADSNIILANSVSRETLDARINIPNDNVPPSYSFHQANVDPSQLPIIPRHTIPPTESRIIDQQPINSSFLQFMQTMPTWPQ